MTNKVARYISMALASWLLISTFLWRHAERQFLIATVVGVLVVAIAPFAVAFPKVWRFDAAMGVLLAIAAFALPHASAASAWHNALIGLSIALVSLMGSREHLPSLHLRDLRHQ